MHGNYKRLMNSRLNPILHNSSSKKDLTTYTKHIRLISTAMIPGKTALMWASSQGRDDVARLLLAAGAEVDYSSKTGNFKGS